MSDAPRPDPIVELRGLRLEQDPPYDTALDVALFTLRAGELALVTVEPGVQRPPLADVLSGLLPAGDGVAWFEGLDWHGRDPGGAARARSRIGRVFDGAGARWISNLDVDENLTLALRFHRGPLDAEAYARIEDFARSADCWPLPDGRHAAVAPPLLRRVEWVRAFAGEPSLLILERPFAGVHGTAMRGLPVLAARALARGAAILWMARDGEPWHGMPPPSSRWRLADGRLAAVEAM